MGLVAGRASKFKVSWCQETVRFRERIVLYTPFHANRFKIGRIDGWDRKFRDIGRVVDHSRELFEGNFRVLSRGKINRYQFFEL